MPAVAGAGVLAVVIVAGLSSHGGASSADTVPSTASIAAAVGPSVSITTLPIVVNSDPGIVKSSLDHTISKGNFGDDVKQVQQRLSELGFAPGPADGQFGSGTQQAVWAYEKLILKTPRDQAKGRITDAMWQVMQDRITIPPRRATAPGSTHVEIYVPEQVLIVFKDNTPELITHISTGVQNPDGSPKKWCEILTEDTDANGNPLPAPVKKDECADAKTPGGIFRFTRRYDGKRVGPLGGMTNPVYFNFGIAIHGAENVPLDPASHGCVRLNQAIAQVFPGMVKKGDLVYVWGQDGKQPEQYSRADSLPSFNYPNPDATTSTSSTTTTVAKTTIPATTTVPKSTTTTTPSVTTSTPPTTTTSSPGATTSTAAAFN